MGRWGARIEPCRPEAPLVNLSHYFLGLFTRTPFFISLLFTFIIRKMGFYYTKWNGVLQRTLVCRHFLTPPCHPCFAELVIAIYLTSIIKPSFYYPCVAVGKFLAVAGFFSRSRLLNFADRDSERNASGMVAL